MTLLTVPSTQYECIQDGGIMAAPIQCDNNWRFISNYKDTSILC